VREQQACIWAANNNRPWWRSWLVPSLRFAPLPLPLLRISFSNSICWPNNGSRLLGGHMRGRRGMQPPVTRESLVQRVSQIRFSPWLWCLHLQRGHFQYSTRSGIAEILSCIQGLGGLQSSTQPVTMAQRVPTDPGPCHACRDEGGHLVAHLGQGLSSCISARQANKATVGPVPYHVVMMHWTPLQIWTRARGQIAEDRRRYA
jgi:hypothetical protein